MSLTLPQIAVLLLLIVAVWIGGPFYLLAVLLLTAAAALLLYQLFRHSGYEPSVGVGVVIALYFPLSYAYAQFASGPNNAVLINVLAVAAIVVFTLVIRLSERDTKRAVLGWALTIGGAVYSGLLSSYLLRLFYLQPSETIYSPNPPTNRLLTGLLADWQRIGLPTPGDVGWPISPAPPLAAPEVQIALVVLIVTALIYIPLLSVVGRLAALAPGFLLILAGLFNSNAISLTLAASLFGLLLATYTQMLLIPADGKEGGVGGWLLPLFHHLAVAAPIVYFALTLLPF